MEVHAPQSALRTPHSALRWWASPGVREVRRLAALPAIITFIMLWPALLNQGVLAPTDIVAYDPLTGNFTPGEPRPLAENPLLTDPADQGVPWRLYARSELESGRFPLWNPYNLLGTHFHANLQSQIFNPYTLLWFLLPSLWGFGAIVALKWTLGGLGMGLLLRRLGLGMGPAVFGSVAFQLAGPNVAWLQWSIADGLLWVPWLLWAALGWLDTRRPGWLAALSFFIAAEILASHIETSFHALLFMGLFALAGWMAIAWHGRERWRVLGGIVAAGALGLALSAVQLLPFLDVLTSSYQWALRQVTQIGEVSQAPMHWLLWLTPNGLGWPDAYLGESNWIEANPYVGALTLLLAVWLLAVEFLQARSKRLPVEAEEAEGWMPPPAATRGPSTRGVRRIRWVDIWASFSPRKAPFWAATLAIAASMAFGVPPLSYLRLLPGFSSSINTRLISVAGVCLVVLAAMGLDRLLSLRGSVLPRRWGYMVGVFAFASVPFLLIGLSVWTFKSDPPEPYVRSWKTWAFALFCIGVSLIVARLLGWIRPRTLIVLAVGVLLADMVSANFNFNPTAKFETFYPPNKITDFLASRGPTERVAVVGPYAGANMLLPYKIADFRSYDATHDNRYVKYTELMSPGTFQVRDASYPTHLLLVEPSAVLQAAVGIRWVVVPVNEDPTSWQPATESGPVYNLELVSNDFWVWENRYIRPYAYFASRIQVAPDEATAYRRMKALTIDRIDQVHIEDPAGAFPGGVESSDTGAPISDREAESVTLDKNVPGEIVVNVEAERTRLLVVNEGIEDGWRAYLDGSPVQLFRANYLVQSVVVPPGPHTVRLAYEPRAFLVGAIISAVALVLWLALIAFSVWRMSRRDMS
ncbi:MAG TPA: YfhO family protein [Chloroflexia bacterium]|nr:YfhO family protein [Chloroflexia bacterium]